MNEKRLTQYDHAHLPTDAEYDAFFDLLETSFPPDEHRTKEGQYALLQKERYHILLLTDKKSSLVALLTYWDFETFCFVEHFAVQPDQRGGGVGRKLLHYLTSNAGKPVFLETVPPNTEIAKRRIGFYKRNGFALNEFDYIQPALRKGGSPLPLRLMSFPHSATEQELHSVVKTLCRYVYEQPV